MPFLLVSCNTGLKIIGKDNKFTPVADRSLLNLDYIPSYRIVEKDIFEIVINLKKYTSNSEREPFSYRLEVGNQIEITFEHDTEVINEYLFDVGDKIQVQFFDRSEFNFKRQIRPDGMIALPRGKDFLVKGMGAEELSFALKREYADIISKPVLTVNLLSIDKSRFQKLNRNLVIMPDGNITLPFIGELNAAGLTNTELKKAITEKSKGLFKNKVKVSTILLNSYISDNNFSVKHNITVWANGEISLPQIGKIKVNGLTVEEVREKIATLAKDVYFNPVDITVNLLASHANQVYIGGEVALPGLYPVTSTTTLMQAIFSANGVKETGALDSVILIRKGPFEKPIVIKTNLRETIYNNGLDQDFVLHPFDIIYVPKTFIANAIKFVDQYFNKLIPFNKSFGMTYSYELSKNRL